MKHGKITGNCEVNLKRFYEKSVEAIEEYRCSRGNSEEKRLAADLAVQEFKTVCSMWGVNFEDALQHFTQN